MAATKITPFKVNARPSALYHSEFKAADEEEGNTFANTGREILLVQSGEPEEKPTKPVILFTDHFGISKKVTMEIGLTAVGPFSVPGYGEEVEFLVEEGEPTLAVVKAVRP